MNPSKFLGVCAISATVLCTSMLTACSDSDGNVESGTTPGSASGQNTSATTLPRSFINNGFYITGVESYNADGSLQFSETHTIDYDANTITVKSSNTPEQAYSDIYRYNTQGDFEGLSLFALFDSDMADPETGLTEESRTTTTYQNERIASVTAEALIGVESKKTTTFTYNEDGTVKRSETNFNDTGSMEHQDYMYENGQLVSITGTYVEDPGVIVNTIFTRNSDGRVATRTTAFDTSAAPQSSLVGGTTEAFSYDANDNVVGIAYTGENGALDGRETFTYEAAAEPVFNGNNFNLFYN